MTLHRWQCNLWHGDGSIGHGIGLLPRVAVPAGWALLALVQDAITKICNGGALGGASTQDGGKQKSGRVLFQTVRVASLPCPAQAQGAGPIHSGARIASELQHAMANMGIYRPCSRMHDRLDGCTYNVRRRAPTRAHGEGMA
jgi:hypothetical protein